MTLTIQPLSPDHDTRGFSCGNHGLDHWLRRHALPNQLTGSTRTFVATQSGEIIGYYSLVVAVIEHEEAPPHVSEGLPSALAIPAVLLARLAVSSKAMGQGYGSVLLADAARRALAVAEQAGVRVLLVHSLDEARSFYAHHGFQPSPTNDRHMMMLIQDIAESLPGESAR